MNVASQRPQQAFDREPSLRVFDRFSSPNPPQANHHHARSAKPHLNSVLGGWSASNSSPAAANSRPDKIPEDSVPEDVTSLKSARFSAASHHRRDESEQTIATALSGAGAGQLTHLPHLPRRDKASQVLGIPHRSSMEPVPVRKRPSIMSTRSAGNVPQSPSYTPVTPLASLYVVSGLPKRPQTWTLADPDAVQGLSHSDGAVNRWWRAEVLGSTVSPGVGGGKKKKVSKGHGSQTEIAKGPGALSKQDTAKMLSKALKLSFTREVEIIASTLQPASTVNTFTFTLPAPSNTPLAPPSTLGLSGLRNSVLSASTAADPANRYSNALSSYGTFPYSYADTHARPSSAYLGPSSVSALDTSIGGSGASGTHAPDLGGAGTEGRGAGSVTYHGVCLTVWSHADAERSAAIRRTLEAVRSRKESAQSLLASRLKALRADVPLSDPAHQARRTVRSGRKGPWSVVDGETDGESEVGDVISESEFEVASTTHGPGESTLFLTGDTVFWLPYALTLVSRHPIYDLMRDYLTLSWARFSKDVASHTLQISKILSHPAPRAGDIVRLDASPKEGGEKGDGSLEVVARFPGGLDFGRGLVDINFTMWPLFKCLNIDNILNICEIALAPTGRILFFSRHPAMLGIAVATIKYLVELRGWNGIALPAVHTRDARIYIEDPGPWIIGMAAEMRYAVRPPPEVCVCDLDINYLNCAMPPPGCLSQKQQRDKYRQKLLTAFGEYYHPDHSVPIEFKEAFPAGRFRPICKIQAKRGASSSVVAESIKAPEWWHSTKIIQAFDSVLQDKYKKPSLFKRISSFGSYKRPPRLSGAEQQVQSSIRKRATAFVDARDDLETKIGRLSRRLNFLMTESDLWREKFVTFEQYAEKLSGEANDLRSKIGKEQRESKRLTGLVSLTAAEKQKLQGQLHDTESAHRTALVELEKMRAAMEKMEEEREQLVEEVEAQIERALMSMSMSIGTSENGDSDYDGEADVDGQSGSSRPVSRLSDTPQSRPVTRAMSTDSATLAGTAENDDIIRHSVESSAIAEENEDESSNGEGVSPPTEREQQVQKRIDASSAPAGEQGEDAMGAVDEGIHTNSDKIAQKVLQIQQKLENALQHPRSRVASWRPSLDSETEGSDRDRARGNGRPISPLMRPNADAMSSRTRSNTMSSSQTLTRAKAAKREKEKAAAAIATANASPSTPKPTVQTDAKQPLEESIPVLSPTTTVTLSPTTSTNPPLTPSVTNAAPVATASTEDSDTDFQSAYSASPRHSYHESEESGLDATPVRKAILQTKEASKRDTVIAPQIHGKPSHGALAGKVMPTA